LVAKQHHASKRGGAEIKAVGSAITSKGVFESSPKKCVISRVTNKATEAIATGNAVTSATTND